MIAFMTDRSWVVDPVGLATFKLLASGLPGSKLQSLLLEVMRRRASSRSPNELLAQYRDDTYCSPAAVDLRTSTTSY